MDNTAIASKLREYAALLEQQDANPFRVRAYERAADAIAGLTQPLSEILDRAGTEGLIALPGIGVAIAGAITQMVDTGGWAQLDRLRGTIDPEAQFVTIPGIGPQLAHSLVADMHLDTLEALEAAANDGSLDLAKGWGKRRVAMVRAALAERLARLRRRRPAIPAVRPDVQTILEVDEAYRRRAAEGSLRLIAPMRFNPERQTWLPILHTERGAWSFTATFSNTARAHQLGRDHDWVVIYHHHDNAAEGQCTVVTETTGPLAGRRVVRGREEECRRLLIKAPRLPESHPAS